MAGDGLSPYSKDVLSSPGVRTEEMFHAVVEFRVDGRVTDHKSDAGHISERTIKPAIPVTN